ncbi:MAG: hypothetical protein IJQ02_02070, partial [Oscillospiraceae bacterium]|nr:hypothetical protein [Oscillospiraceae bacterium]
MFTIKSASVRERRVRRTLSALISAVLLFAFLISGFAAAEDAEESPSLLDSLMSGTYDYQYHLTDSELPEPAEVWTYRSGL